MSTSSAQTAYTQARAAHQAAYQALQAAERAVEQSEDRMEQAEQAYLDALGAPALNSYVSFNAKRVMKVTQRKLVTSKAKTPSWRVSGSLHEAKGGQWVQVKQFDHLSKTNIRALSAEDVQARLVASKARARRTTKGALRLGSNELSFLKTMKFAEGTSFQAPTGILFGQGGSLRGNVLIAENLHRKGVLDIPRYKAQVSYSVTPDWYREPMKKGPRAAEACALLAQSSVPMFH